MILCCRINHSSDLCNGEFLSCADIVRTAADLYGLAFAEVHLAHMKMRIGDGLALCHKSHNNTRDVVSHFVSLFHFKARIKELFFKNIRGNVYINIIL